jgi:hypothetical protein
MTAGWEALCYAGAFGAFVLASLLVLLVTPRMKRPWWKVLVALGLALVTLVPLWAAASAA